MKKILFFVLCVIATLSACDDTTGTLGMDVTNTADLLNVSDGTYKITSRSVIVDSVLSKSTLGYLGTVKDPETGAYVNCDFLTQFAVLSNTKFADKERLKNGVSADSCDLRLFYNSYYGDSLTAMKATVYELRKPVEEGRVYYTSFDPEKEGMVRIAEGAVKKGRVYSLVNTSYKDSVRQDGSYTDNIRFLLSDEYTSAEGKKYNNYGTYLMDKYYENPDNFSSSYKFIHNVCPGFYVKMENGVGAMAYISNTRMNVYYQVKDTAQANTGLALGGTEEVMQVSKVTKDKVRLEQLAADNSCTYIKAPAGIFTELTLPIEEICLGHESDSINSAKVVLRCFNKSVDSEFALSAPTNIIMLEKDSLDTFFESGKVVDYRRNYIANYVSAQNSYTFNNIGQLVKHIYGNLPKNAVEREQWKKEHPNWDKVLLVPVNASYTSYGTTSILTRISHDMGMSSVRLVGGPDSKDGDITLSVIYSNFK